MTLRIALWLVLVLTSTAAAGGPLRVVTTTADLADLTRQVGGEEVEVRSLTRGPQDPHFVEPRPSFVRDLHRADLFVLTGLDLELGWAPVLLRQARNGKIQRGSPGYLDASAAIVPLEVPVGPVDRSQGDVHPYGNPHYLLDPLNALRVAALLRDTLAALRPEAREALTARYRSFATRLVAALAGAELVERHGADPLAARIEEGTLDPFLAERGEEALLGGWLARLRPHAGVAAVQDHRLWPYFARRFDLRMVETLEPKPGIAPTTRHLARVVERARAEGVKAVLASPYFDPRHARWVAERTDGRVVEMAHQPGSRPDTDDYLAMVDANVRGLLEAL